MDIDNPVPEMILSECGRRGITVAEMARQSGVKQSALAHIIGRTRALGPDLARKLAPALQLSQVELFRLAGLIDEPADYTEDRAAQRIRILFREADDETKEQIVRIAETLTYPKRAANSGKNAGKNSGKNVGKKIGEGNKKSAK